MSEPVNGTRYRLERLEKDTEDLRREQAELRRELVKVDVLMEKVDNLEDRVSFLIKTLWTTFGGLLMLCFTFLWATAQGWIGG